MTDSEKLEKLLSIVTFQTKMITQLSTKLDTALGLIRVRPQWMSKRQIREKTGLSKADVNAIIERENMEGLILGDKINPKYDLNEFHKSLSV